MKVIYDDCQTMNKNIMERKPALCLDWDGTIRRSKSGHKIIKNWEDIELIPGVEDQINWYKKAGYLIIGISNQGGVAFGYKLPMEIERERDATLELFKLNPFHIIKMCYHHEEGSINPYNFRSILRKPNTGMLAIAEFDAYNAGYILDWNNSLFVGDRPEDEQCAKNADIKFMHINEFLKPHKIELKL